MGLEEHTMKIIEANPYPHHEFGELAIGDMFKMQGFDKLYIKTNEIFSQGLKLNAFCFDNYDLESFWEHTRVIPYDAELTIFRKGES